MTELTFREATSGDAEHVAALVESAYRGDSGREGWTLEASLVSGRRTDASAVATLIAAPDTRILLAHRAGMLVGSCLIERRADGAYLGMLSVRPHLQRSGVGRALVEAAERRAAALWGGERVAIQVLQEDQRLVDWYTRQGYAPTGSTSPFVPGNGAVPRRPLRFVAMAKRLGAGAAR